MDKSAVKKRANTGWSIPWDARKYHYFVESRSLCRRWTMFNFSPMPGEKVSTGSRCARCERTRVERGEQE